MISLAPLSAFLLRALAAATLMCLAMSSLAAVYKTTDAQGNVVYTDVPPRTDSDAKQTVEVINSNTYAPTVSATPTNLPEPEPIAEEAPAYRYEGIRISSPQHDTAVRENAGNVTVSTEVSPGLQDGHRIRILLDGQPWPELTGGTLQLRNIDRGTHTLSAEIVDSDNQVLVSSDPITFHLLRVSVLTRPR